MRAIHPGLRLTTGIDVLIPALVVVAWTVTLLLIGVGRGDLLLDHDSVLGDRTLSWPVALVLFLLSWQVMTAAMMLPSSLPMMRIFLGVSRRQPDQRSAFGVFLLAYFAVWTGFAIAALAGDFGLHRLVDQWPWLEARPGVIAGTLIMASGLFQFSSLKERCLQECRDPLSFLWRRYARGNGAAWRIGIQHGMFCLGCCWALMLMMFAVGMSSLTWMAALTSLMVLEKSTPQGRKLVPVVGAALIAWGAIVLLRSL